MSTSQKSVAFALELRLTRMDREPTLECLERARVSAAGAAQELARRGLFAALGLGPRERLPDEDGLPVWTEDIGSTVVPVRTVEATPPRKLVRRMTDSVVPMTAAWSLRSSPTRAASGSGSTTGPRFAAARGTYRSSCWS